MSDDLVLVTVQILVKREDVPVVQETLMDAIGNADAPMYRFGEARVHALTPPEVYDDAGVIEWADDEGITLPQ